MQTMGQRIKNIRQELQMSQEQFGKLFDSGKAYISLVENNKSKLSVENLVKLLLNYNVNINYVLSGNGTMFLNNCENTHALIVNEQSILRFKNWGKRLNQILSENEETPYAFSKRTGITESRIEKFLLDSVEPTITEVNAIKSNVDISIDWLLYGENIEKSTQTDSISLSTDEILKLKQILNKTNF